MPVETAAVDCLPIEIEVREPGQLASHWRTILDSLCLVCLLAVISAGSIKLSGSMDEDLWWHLRAGNWILQHRAVPIHDSFASHTAPTQWVAYSWLFEVLVSEIFRHYGLHGILTLTTLLMFACSAALLRLFSRYTTFVRAMMLVAVAMIAMLQLAAPRPWWFTILFFICELDLLLEARERGHMARLWLVVPLFAFWANIHIQFVYGLGLLALFALEQPLRSYVLWPAQDPKLRARWLWLLLGASALATLANPYGWHLYSVVRQYAEESAPLRMITEMRAFEFRSITDWAALLLACGAFFAQGSSPKKCPLMLGLLAVSCWCAFRSARDVWFLATIAGLVVARSLPAKDAANESTWKRWAIALPSSLALIFAVLFSSAQSEAHLREAVDKRFPEAAAAYVQNHRLAGPLYNSYDWGGYLMWRLPNLPVSIDGRANLHGDEHLTRWASTYFGKRDWDGDPQLTKANTIVLEHNSALASILRSDERYRLVYEDDLAAVFQPAHLRP